MPPPIAGANSTKEMRKRAILTHGRGGNWQNRQSHLIVIALWLQHLCGRPMSAYFEHYMLKGKYLNCVFSSGTTVVSDSCSL
jgi:hypothetical protein